MALIEKKFKIYGKDDSPESFLINVNFKEERILPNDVKLELL